jgi:hypothetical protein
MTGRWLGLGIALLLAACAGESSKAGNEKTHASSQPLTTQLATQTIKWGDAPDTLGLKPWVRESLPKGAPAVAISATGQVFVLDALHERVVKATKGDLVQVAQVPRDSEDLAVSADGAIAVLRTTKPEVLVFTPNGELVGKVDTSALESVDGIALGASRRVTATNPFQETFPLGSPSMPQGTAAIRAAGKTGAAFLADGRGVVGVHTESGDIELRAMKEGNERTDISAKVALGKGDAIRIVGASGTVACARIEHVTQDAANEITTKREVACVDVASGATLLRKDLPMVGAYLPRRELAFANGNLVFAEAKADGLEVTTWKIEGGVR